MRSGGNARRSSLRGRIQISYVAIICVMMIPSVYAVTVALIHSDRYNDSIASISRANKINLIVQNSIPDELWDIVSGRKNFSEGDQYAMLDEIDRGLEEMKTLTKNGRRLEVAHRAWETLSRNISRLGIQMMSGASVAENQITLDEIRSIASLFSDVMQDFIMTEIESAYRTNVAIRRSAIVLTVAQIFILVIAVLISAHNVITMSQSIQKPIAEMKEFSAKITRGDLSARVETPDVEELKDLAANLNITAGRIDSLIKGNLEKQAALQKAEMKTLQSQITPHFLYNTFDTIVWLAEEGRAKDAVRITRALSDFLRISLSRGHERITVRQELEHVRNYLTIQKIRYADTLNYEISAEDGLDDLPIPKLILQPLVENAIYHGIKNKRGHGHLKVTAKFSGGTKEFMTFSVEDDGAGFTPDRLAQIRDEIASADSENLTSAYGLFNVNKRLFLYYPGRTEGLQIESEHRRGARISFTIPCRAAQESAES